MRWGRSLQQMMGVKMTNQPQQPDDTYAKHTQADDGLRMSGQDNLQAVAERLAVNLTNSSLSARIDTIYAVLYSQSVVQLQAQRRELVAGLPETEYPLSLDTDRFGMPLYSEPIILDSVMSNLPYMFKAAWNGGRKEATDQVKHLIEQYGVKE